MVMVELLSLLYQLSLMNLLVIVNCKWYNVLILFFVMTLMRLWQKKGLVSKP